MKNVEYSKTSPYATTGIYGNALDVLSFREIPKLKDDILYEIDAIYKNRPDLLAYDLYDDSSLWWVFSVRNPNVLQDPVFDFLPGARIYIPKKSTIKNALGV